MDSILDMLRDIWSRGSEQMLGRAGGPMNTRLLITPTLALFFAIRAGLREAREGASPFLWKAITQPAERPKLRRTWWKDIGKMIIVAIVIDALYQFYLFHAFFIGQTLILVVVLAMGPYALARTLTTFIARGFIGKRGGPADPPGGHTTGEPEDGHRRS